MDGSEATLGLGIGGESVLLDGATVRAILIVVSLAMPLFTTGALAQDAHDVAAPNCWAEAGRRYSVDPWLLVAIARVESRMKPDAIGQNADGSIDIGLMQINSTWLPTLRKFGIGRESLLDPCTSINVAAWIVSANINQFGNNWEAIGRYHSSSPGLKAVWLNKVFAELRAIRKGP